MSFVGLYTGSSGIRAAQVGIDTASHNVANANSPGYTRQRVELGARPTYESPNGRIGTGVDVQDIARLRDSFLDGRYRSAVGDHEHSQVRAEVMEAVEELTGEPEQGLSTRFGELWSAAEDWVNDPASPAARTSVITELGSIAEGMRTISRDWDQLGRDTADRRDVVVDEVNATLEAVDDLNRRIANAEPGRIGADLYDQRDLLLDELAEQIGASTTIDETDRAIVTSGGTELVTADGHASFSVDEADGELRLTPIGEDDPAAGPLEVNDAGELFGLQRALNEDLPARRAELDELAQAFAAEINHVNTLDPDGDPFVDEDGTEVGAELLAFDPDDPAGTIGIADGISGADLIAGATGDASSNDPTNARRFTDVQDGALLDPEGTDPLETQLADLVIGLAGEVRSLRNAADAAQGVASGAEMARSSEHAVSLDEEMVDLVRFQRALEASSRVMTTVDEALDVLVNRTGTVGR